MVLSDRNDSSLDTPTGDVSTIYSAIGAGNFVGRIFAGYVCDLPQINPIIITAASSFLAGILVAFLPYQATQTDLIIFCSLYGFAIGPIFTLPVKLLSDLFGITQFPKYLGIDQLVRGISLVVAISVAGWIYDATNSYVWAFAFDATCFMIGGVFWIILYVLKRISIEPPFNGQ